ncbi:hypothetical protein RM780_05810 [Streptomyces sp. DSM 44917]|uniref:Uncharacterized protein n=1 Tax=Streptomyces boetiae TaxID=3075541 RepID=A0ABU2L4J1_9ACTN|nr:hypothetical protein [Streptomyces sp. DSM 44917]MDT0306474.1 hypothetical protein [Streptomyces sp. DSM 44917]
MTAPRAAEGEGGEGQARGGVEELGGEEGGNGGGGDAGEGVGERPSCGDTRPVFPGKTYLDWALEDPAGQGLAAVRPIRDEIRKRVGARRGPDRRDRRGA